MNLKELKNVIEFLNTIKEEEKKQLLILAENIVKQSQSKTKEWVTYTIDLTENAAWKGIIKNLRFDPFNAVGTMEIDYMKFIEDENYVITWCVGHLVTMSFPEKYDEKTLR